MDINIPDPLFTVETDVHTGEGDNWRDVISTDVTVRFGDVVIFTKNVPASDRGYSASTEEDRARNIAVNDVALRLRVLLGTVSPHQVQLAAREEW